MFGDLDIIMLLCKYINMQTHRTTIDFDRETMAILRNLAWDEGVPMRKVMSQAVADYAAKKKRVGKKKKTLDLGSYNLGEYKFNRADAYE